MRARLAALVAGLLVVAGFPLLLIIARSTEPASGDLDLSQAWAWPPVVLAGLATSAAVYFWLAQRDRVRAVRASAGHATFEYHDEMLQPRRRVVH